MSKMTFFKRVSIAVIAALGFSMLATTSSSAAISGQTLTIDAATDANNIGETATAVITHNFLRDSYDSMTVKAILLSGNPGGFSDIRMVLSDSSTNLATSNGDGTNDPSYVTVDPTIGDANTGTEATRNMIVSSENGTRRASDTQTAFAYDHPTNPDSFTVSAGTSASRATSKFSVKLINLSLAGTYVVRVSTTGHQLNNPTGSGAGTLATVEGQYVDWTITVTAVSTKPDATSVSVLRAGTASYNTDGTGGTTATDSATTASVDTAEATPAFTIWTLVNNILGASGADNAIDSLTVTTTGEAFVGVSSSTASVDRAITLTTDAAPDATGTPVYIWSTGNTGTATITVNAVNAGLTWTKTVTFYGDVAKLEVTTSKYKIARTGGNTTSGMFNVTATDAAGTKVPGLTLSVISSDYGQIASGSCTDASSGVEDGVYSCSLVSAAISTSGGKATATVRILDPGRAAGTTSYLTTTYDVTLGGGVSSVVLTTDKASYDPGEKMVVTATAKDASGNPVYDGATGPTLSANKALGGTLTMNVYVGGVSTSQTRSSTTGLVTAADTIYAPAASGKFRVSGLAGDAASTPISVEATVTDDGATAAANAATDAAAEAIDAANAATDAANLAAEAADAATVAAEEARDAADAATAAVEALATEVATLMAALKAQITTLANTVAKIAKKVKA